MISTSDLPALNAFLNGTSAVLLFAGYVMISRRNIAAHRACMTAALVTSSLFLISYLTYHFNHGSTKFMGQGWIRTVYFGILISHTFLATVIVPLVIMTVRRAIRGDFLKHARIARITLPLWFYVSITGVIVYLMLYQLYPRQV
jgi:putative membrane protein